MSFEFKNWKGEQCKCWNGGKCEKGEECWGIFKDMKLPYQEFKNWKGKRCKCWTGGRCEKGEECWGNFRYLEQSSFLVSEHGPGLKSDDHFSLGFIVLGVLFIFAISHF